MEDNPETISVFSNEDIAVLRSGKARGVRFGTINRICYYLDCDVGDILKFDGNLEAEDEKEE